ncbi:MAG: CRISPR-associated ring nuclease Csm6 [Bryobacterales bacterium]|nr:CRISPR-associated ring nuclease Csm6 [Bryobacteraceae bacterium]MDW8355784.1 CRISPR-associated ring nuclease Csm6 [Bryobacterales bacterium]
MRDGAEFPRRVLLAVCGLSPQVLTETVYALAVKRRPPFLPTEIHLATTEEGARRARLTLLGRSPGWFHKLCKEYRLGPIRFGEEQIHVLAGEGGARLADIRTREDNEKAADQIAELVRQFTSDERTALHVSIAGGRKTTGFYAGYALSLFGRPQDRMSHVLVSAPFESHPEFYFPTRQSRIIYTPPPDSRPLDTRTAEVTLAEIPFVRLRKLLPPRLLAGGLSYAELVKATEETLGGPELVFEMGRGRVRAGGQAVRLRPAELAFYSWMARRRLSGREPVPCPSDGAPERAHAEEFLAEYRRTEPGAAAEERARAALRGGMEKSYFLERKSRVNRALEEALGPGAWPYKVQGFGKRPETRFGLALEPGQIRYADPDEEEQR